MLSYKVFSRCRFCTSSWRAQILDQTRPLGRGEDSPALRETLAEPLQTDFKAQQRHLQQLVVSLDNALGSLVSVQQQPSKVPRRTSAVPRQSRSSRDRAGKVGRGPSHAPASKDTQAITPESAAALAVEALAAVKISLALAQHDSGGDAFSRERRHGQQQQQQAELDGAKELRSALARAIGALRNACVGAASSTAELLGGQDPTGFAEEVRALANAHEKELEQAMAEERPVLVPALAAGSTSAASRGAGLAGAAENVAGGGGGGPGVGLEFWSRQSDLWSGVFAEQQMGLLQMVRAQEAELRQGKRRVSSLEKELSALSDKRAEMENATAEATGRGDRGRSLDEKEADEWRQRLDRIRTDYERRAEALRDRESAVAAAEARVESRARELGSERDRLKTGAVALSAEADGLRWVWLVYVAYHQALVPRQDVAGLVF